MLHLILYAEGAVFEDTKQLLINSIKLNTKYEVKIHEFSHKKLIEKYEIYNYITKLLKSVKDIENIPKRNIHGYRDGCYNYFKPFIINLVLNEINYGDIIYYCDCSQYFITGFTENIDNLVDMCISKDAIAGCVGINLINDTYGICDSIKIITKIYNILKIKLENEDLMRFLNKTHINNSILLFKKTDLNIKFTQQWLFLCTYPFNPKKRKIYNEKDPRYALKYPIITYHHTVDQSIFNILVHLYKLPSIVNRNYNEYELRDRNLVAKIANLDDLRFF